MPYYTGDAYGYRGDYYRGDYYRGDPGLFSFLGKALGGIAKAGLGVAKGALGLSSPGAVTITGYAPPVFDGGGMIPVPPRQGIFSPGPSLGARVLQPGTALEQASLAGAAMGRFAACPKGYHSNKSTYVTRGGGTSRWPMALALHPKGTTCVRSRRMNVGNARALRRAIRRVAGFAKIVKRSRRAIARAASAVGVHRGRPRHAPRAPSVKVVRAA